MDLAGLRGPLASLVHLVAMLGAEQVLPARPQGRRAHAELRSGRVRH